MIVGHHRCTLPNFSDYGKTDNGFVCLFYFFLYKKSQSIKIKSAGIYFGNEHRNSEHEMSGDGYEMNFSYLMSLASSIFAFVSSL